MGNYESPVNLHVFGVCQEKTHADMGRTMAPEWGSRTRNLLVVRMGETDPDKDKQILKTN